MQAKMNYSWNIRTLRNESSEITRIVNEANEIIDKVNSNVASYIRLILIEVGTLFELF